MKKFYFFLVALLAMQSGLMAQSPGGVSANLSLWLRADASSTLSPTTGSLNGWTYFNNSNSFAAPAGFQPTVAPSTFNFLPSIAFNGTQYMAGPNGPGVPGAPIPALSLAYSVFAVWSSTTAVFGNNQRVWCQRPASNAFDNNFDGAALWIYPNGPAWGDQPEISPFLTGVATNPPGYTTFALPYVQNKQYISQMNFLAQNTSDLELVDQTNFATGPIVLSTDPNNNATVDRILTDGANLLGARNAPSGSGGTMFVANDEPFFGNLAEMIVYTGPVSGASRNQVFSYLSLKYGIPLNSSYVSSAGTTTWDAVANGSYGFNSDNYNNNVFGVGQDNGSGLSTTQSNPQTTGSGNGVGQPGLGNMVITTTAPVSDQNFLIIGSDNGALTETTTNLSSNASVGSERLARQWVAQSTGNVGLVNLSFDFTNLTITGHIPTLSAFGLVVDNDGDGDFTTGTGGQFFYAPSSFTGNVANFMGVNLSAGTSSNKVVFQIMSNNASGMPLPVNWTSFTAVPVGGNVDLSWGVTANQNAKVYLIDHSTDGANFTQIGEVANDPAVESYSFVHVNAGAGKHYYRIQEVDIDGKAIYSQIISVNLTNQGDFAVRALNNPVVGNVQAEIEINASKAGNASIEVWNLAGEKLATQIQAVNTGATRIPLAMMNSLASTTYVVKVKIGNVTQTLQIVKL